ncbi:MAG: glycosyltransferase family 39 protein [Candidatus Sulfotelmatobacter sp.]
MALSLAVLLCPATGYLIIALGVSRTPSAASDVLLRLSLAAGYGLGVFSVIFLAARAIGITNLLVIDFLAFAVLLAVYLRMRPPRTRKAEPLSSEEPFGPTWLPKIVTAAFVIALCTAVYSSILRALVHPHGDGWDAFSIWNLHARFLFRGGAAWREGFSPLIPWSHPDYPLLLPAAIAHFWNCLGYENQAIPSVIGLVFTFSTVGVLFSSLAILRGRTPAMLGALTLLATPFFIQAGTSQYADVPLSFFYLAAISLVCLHNQTSGKTSLSRPRGLLILAGLAAGLAAWTKNEGALFLCALVAAWLLRAVRRRRSEAQGESPDSAAGRTQEPFSAFLFLLGVASPLILLAWFKHSVAPPGDLFSDRRTALHKLLDLKRYRIILEWYGKEFLRFGDWFLIPETIALAVFYFLSSKSRKFHPEPGIAMAIITLALTLAGYFAIYLITPYDLYWHLRFSLNRLFLQLWPSAIFIFFLKSFDCHEKRCTG